MFFDASDAPILLLDAEFADIDQMVSAVQAWDLDFRPLANSVRTNRVGRIVQARFGPMDVGYARFHISLDQLGAPPRGQCTFGIPDIGMKRLWWRGYDLGNDTILAFPLGGDLKSVSGPDFNIHTVSVDENVVASICEAFKLPLPKPSLRPEVFRPPADLLAYLRQQLRSFSEGLGSVCASGAQQMLETLVLLWLRPAEEPKHRRPNLRARDRSIARCLESMEADGLATLTPAQLCKIGGISERSLQYAFLERFGVSPGAFLKMRRLGAIRAALQMAHHSNTSIGDLAASYGFWHSGQFAADYRRMFGESPSETLRK